MGRNRGRLFYPECDDCWGTATTQVDVQGNYAAFRQMLDDGTTNIYIVNNGGTFTAYAVGETPTADLAVQVTCSDVTPPQ